MLRPVPHQGIELLLGDVRPIRAFQDGGDYWELDAQKLIRSTRLGRFLPRVEAGAGPAEAPEQPRGAVLFQLVHGGREVASASVSRPQADIPPQEVEALAEAAGDLVRLAADPACDPSKKRLLESFRLPDPAALSECYRTYGPFWNRRLLVLWGYEHREGESIDPAGAVKKLAPRTDRGYRLKRWLAAALALAAVLAFLAGAWWLVRHISPGPAAGGDGNMPAPGLSRDANYSRNLDANRAVPAGRDANLVKVPSGDGNLPPVTIPMPAGTHVVGVLTFGRDANSVLIRVIRPDGNVVNTLYPWDWLRLFHNLPILFDPVTRNFIPTGPLTIDPAYRDRAFAARPLEEVAWSVAIRSELVGGQYVLSAELSPDIADLKVLRWVVGGLPRTSTENTIRVPAGQETSVEVWAESAAEPGKTLKQTIQIGKH